MGTTQPTRTSVIPLAALVAREGAPLPSTAQSSRARVARRVAHASKAPRDRARDANVRGAYLIQRGVPVAPQIFKFPRRDEVVAVGVPSDKINLQRCLLQLNVTIIMEVWYVRHGERCDEVPRDKAERIAWRRSAMYRQGRRYDPPLTQLGHAQADRVGAYLVSLPFNLNRESAHLRFDRVYTSPLMRTVQTAVCISRAFGALPLQVVPGLCSCTAALRRIGFENATLMSDGDIRDKFPDVTLIPRDPSASISFRGAVDWIAERPRQRVLCVGHREGIKELAGRSVPTPYCCIGIFRVDRESKQYQLVDLLTKDLDSLM